MKEFGKYVELRIPGIEGCGRCRLGLWNFCLGISMVWGNVFEFCWALPEQISDIG